MSSPQIKLPGGPPADRLGIANAIGLLALAFSLTALVILFLDSGYRSSANRNDSQQLVRALDLNSLSLTPSGRQLRYPGAINQTIDLRFDPRLGRLPCDGADLILIVPD